MTGNVAIVSIADVKGRLGGIGREGMLFAKPLPLDPGPGAPGMEFDWVSYGADYGTPRHRHTFQQFRYVLKGRRDIKDGVLEEGDCAYYPEGVHYGPQAQTAPMIGVGLQFEGDSGIPYLRHSDLLDARNKLKEEGGTFANGVYTRVMPDGRKINKDGHAACFEAITGRKLEFPEGRYETPIVVRPASFSWVPDAHLSGVEHKHLGTFGERRSGMGIMRLAAGARIPAHRQEIAKIMYVTEGSITYDGKTWRGGNTDVDGTYLFLPHGSDVGEIGSETGASFFVISLPMLGGKYLGTV
jgi:quercetin dioxygenase-like cupin family protein